MHFRIGDYLKIRARGQTYKWSLVPKWINTYCPRYADKISYWEEAREGEFGTIIYSIPSTITPSMDICLFRTNDGKYFVFCADGLEKEGG